jgi:hypothetical protein
MILFLSIITLHSRFRQSQILENLTKHKDKYVNMYNMKNIFCDDSNDI